MLSVQKWQWVERARTSVRPFFSQLTPGSRLPRSVPAVTGCWNSIVFGLAGAGCGAGAVTTWFLNITTESKTATTRVAKFAAISTLRNSDFHRPVSATDRNLHEASEAIRDFHFEFPRGVFYTPTASCCQQFSRHRRHRVCDINVERTPARRARPDRYSDFRDRGERRSTRYKRSTATSGIRRTDYVLAFVFNVNGGVRDVSPSPGRA